MAQHRHKRETNARKLPRATIVAAPLAVLATASAVTIGVVAANPGSPLMAASTNDLGSQATGGVTLALGDRALGSVSRSLDSRRGEEEPAKQKPVSEADKMLRASEVKKAVRGADTTLWTTDDLNIWSEPGKKAELLGEIEAVSKVLVTGRELYGRQEIVRDGKARWVTAGYLSKDKPELGPTLDGSCTNGSTVPSGVAPGVAAVHEAVCANWPEITSYGTFRSDSDSDHSSGRAVDIMVSGSLGQEIADFLRENYAEFDISYIIYSQQIWSVERSGEGWRGMEDRGSTTANHYDHVHVSVY